MSIPEISEEIKGAAADYNVANSTIKPRPSYNTDRISFLIFKCAIPMYGYKGVDNYRSVKRVVGAHLYENSAGDPRDWRNLHDITPYSCINEGDITPYMADRAAIVERAKEKEILVRRELGSDCEFVIREVEAEKVASMTAAAEATLKTGDLVKIKALSETLEGEGLPVAGEYHVKNIGADNCEDLVIKDLIIASDFLKNKLETGLKLVDAREAVIASLRSSVDQIGAKKSSSADFARALVSGAIRQIDRYTYAYVTESYGIEDVVNLTTLDSEPYGMTLPLYSAYVEYTALADDVKQAIVAATKANLVDDAKVDAALASTQEALTKLNAFVQVAKTSYPEKAGEIAEFFTGLAAAVNNFAMTR